jgi:hypothetical protein
MYKLSCENTGEITEGIKGNKGLEVWRKVDEGNILIRSGRKEERGKDCRKDGQTKRLGRR